jgi:hypothetical protein
MIAMNIRKAIIRGGLAFSLALPLCGCGSFVSSNPVIGLPDGTPKSVQGLEYLPVNDLPVVDRPALLTIDEQDRLAADLVAARDRNEKRAADLARNPIKPF